MNTTRFEQQQHAEAVAYSGERLLQRHYLGNSGGEFHFLIALAITAFPPF